MGLHQVYEIMRVSDFRLFVFNETEISKFFIVVFGGKPEPD